MSRKLGSRNSKLKQIVSVEKCPNEEQRDLPIPNCQDYIESLKRIEDDSQHTSKKIGEVVTPKRKREKQFDFRGSWAGVISAYQICSKNANVKAYIDRCGWSQLFTMDMPKSDNNLVSSMVERWWDTSHTFHLPTVELGLTPIDFTMLTGLLVAKGVTPPYSDDPYSDFLVTKMRFFPELQDVTNYSKKGIKLTDLSHYWDGSIVIEEENRDGKEERVARAFMMYTIGHLFFPNGSSVTNYGWFASFDDLSKVGDYDWGGAILARIYIALDECSRGMKSFNGMWQLIEYWAYEYLTTCKPILKKDCMKDSWPRFYRWERDQRVQVRNTPRFNLLAARSQLATKDNDVVIWNPFHSSKHMERQELQYAFHLSQHRVLLCDPQWGGIWYLGDRCWRQFTGQIVIPSDPPSDLTSLISLDAAIKLHDEGWIHASQFVVPIDQDTYDAYWSRVGGGPALPPLEFCDWSARVAGSGTDILTIPVPSATKTHIVPPAPTYTQEQWRSLYEDCSGFARQLEVLLLQETTKREREIAHRDATISSLERELQRERERAAQEIARMDVMISNRLQSHASGGASGGSGPYSTWTQPGGSMDGEDIIKGDKLILRGLKFHGFHGVKPEEKTLGQKFVIDVDAWLDLRTAGKSDILSDTVSYTEIYRIVREVVEGPSHDLLESVAHKIAVTTLTKFVQISAVRVKVGKPHVAVHGTVDYLGIAIIRYRKTDL